MAVARERRAVGKVNIMSGGGTGGEDALTVPLSTMEKLLKVAVPMICC